MQETLQPITADDDTIREALEHAHLPSLLNALVHITGDPSHIRGDVRPRPGVLADPLANVTPDQMAAVRETAFRVLCDLRDNPREPVAPSDDLVHEMTAYLTGDNLPEEYVDAEHTTGG